jgi:hypothetical protein
VRNKQNGVIGMRGNEIVNTPFLFSAPNCDKKKFINEDHCNILIKKFYRYFYFYLLIF